MRVCGVWCMCVLCMCVCCVECVFECVCELGGFFGFCVLGVSLWYVCRNRCVCFSHVCVWCICGVCVVKVCVAYICVCGFVVSVV